MGFTHFKFHPAIAAGIREAGYSHPTPIQKDAIPKVMEGRDVLGLAQTGTGKTAAFALPILHRLCKGERHRTRALIVAPTRELAEQIDASFKLFSHQSGLKSATVYGGVGQRPQVDALKRGTEVIVACPGRLLDLIDQGHADMGKVEVLVLDEADQMFDMGFLPMIRKILQKLPQERQTLLFSATMPDEIRKLAEDMLRNPTTVQVDKVKPAATVKHALYPVAQHLKTPLLMNMLESHQEGSILVFTRTKHRAKRIGEQLQKAGLKAASIQGNLSQNRRQEAMDGFRDGSYRILVATDIAARGIDVSLVSLVVNYDIPETAEMYIHRIGRTGRAERSGEAMTFVTGEDGAMIRAIEKLLGKAIEKKTIAGFDYNVPAPKKDEEFKRPPREPQQRRNPASKKGAAQGQPAVKAGNDGKPAPGRAQQQSQQQRSESAPQKKSTRPQRRREK
ncbi:ATP-dependent RNA helicase RhlE [Geobacter sp. OR-1]|uniref:DEAD/DEAH box helicase n=1 Tax=Geobacter sp. OR-1 TaxID=1266765 RepID=UPI000542BBF5|nr:DEAD/DEAH box helicase [Geobacter sp. OR-1]GAM11547.1 ATP-dependent RNA helicase RhlE [Geobacter sp. OR-1]